MIQSGVSYRLPTTMFCPIAQVASALPCGIKVSTHRLTVAGDDTSKNKCEQGPHGRCNC